jgi:hypothetical protein
MGSKWSALSHYCSETNHPFVQLFYLLIGPVAFYVCSWTVLAPKMPALDEKLFYALQLVALIAFYHYVKSCLVEPGQVTPENVSFLCRTYAHFEDGVMFKDGATCTTCQTPK